MASGTVDPVSWCRPRPAAAMTRPISAAESSGRRRGGWGPGRHDFLDDVALHQLGRRLRLTDRPQEGDPFQHERNREHRVADAEVGGRYRPDQFLHTAGDRQDSAGDEQSERREQGPDIGLSPVTQRMRIVRRAARPPVGDEQEHLVPRIRPRVRGFREDGRGPRDRRGDGLRDGHQHVRGERDEDRRDARGRARGGRSAERAEERVRRPGPLARGDG